MRLTDLEPQFITFHERDGQRTERYVETLAEAQGVFFGCPVHYVKNGNSMVGTHGVMVAFADRGVPDHLGSHDKHGKPSRWHASGSGYGDLTLTPSIDISQDGDGEWHGYITSGEVR